jgi:hypothetical protein
MMIIDTAKRSLLARPHRGRMHDVSGAIAAAVATTEQVLTGFAADWNLLRSARFTQVAFGGAKRVSVPAVLKVIAEDGSLDGLRGDKVYAGLMAAWHKEPGESLADVVNAVTRFAHEGDTRGHTTAIERAGGALLAGIARQLRRAA